MNSKEIVKNLILTTNDVSSIAELERKLDIANGTINKWDGRSQPTVKVLEKIANYFNVSIDYILGRETNNSTEDLNEVLDNIISYDGKPMTEHDKELIRAFLEGKFGN